MLAALAADGLPAALTKIEQAESAKCDLASQLRYERGAASLLIALADLAGWTDLEGTTAALTHFADDALHRALCEAMRERTGDPARRAPDPREPDARGIVAIALGKQGGGDLNYSSDIDPIFLYDPQALPRRAREDAGQAAVRIVRRVVDLLQSRTADGYVLRVDLRLRPSPEVSPIAVPMDVAISHYESSALTWERAAFIRARAAGGDTGLGNHFLDAISPFVWRRSLDFGAIGEIAGVSHRIREQYADGQWFGPNYDLKRGRGGIREVEFFTQLHQLIHGGRDPSLRARGTLPALRALAIAGHIDPAQAEVLEAAYRALRTIEHRLQMIDDQQTHSLPTGTALDEVARLHGLTDGTALLDYLEPHVEAVGAAYDRLARPATSPAFFPSAPSDVARELDRAGFPDVASAGRQIAAWRRGDARSLRSPAAREAFESVLPSLLDAFGRTGAPNEALHRFDDLVRAVPSGINLYRLLQARPALTGMFAQVLGFAPALAAQLARSPELLDGLIDASILEPPPPVAELVERFGQALPNEEESALRLIARRIDEWRFALGVQLVAASRDPLAVGEGYARVAEAAVAAFAGECVRRFTDVHGTVPGSELVIVGLGRLGGALLTHASDLDLVYLFTGDLDRSSDGAKPLRATDYFNRLARRITAALGLPTAAGPLYQVDTRLRPSGVHGMLAVTVDAFDSYQRDAAWTFEHMALTRARVLWGSAEARAQVEGSIASILTRARDHASVTADAVNMRGEIARHKPPAGPLDVKRAAGGLIDLEFAIHVRQLSRRVGIDPRLDHAIRAQIDARLLPPEISDAYRLLTRLLVTLRLVAPDAADPGPAAKSLVAAACGFRDWSDLCQALDEARALVATVWNETAGRIG